MTLWLLRVVALLHVCAAILQPVAAGAYLGGEFDALALHDANAVMVYSLGLTLIPVTLVYWVFGRGRGWTVLAAGAFFFFETVQTGVGYERMLGIHIPLGVAIVVTSVLFAIWVFRPGAKRPRRSYRELLRRVKGGGQ